MATREGVRLLAEAKGITSAPGLDGHTAYGQLLRRMPETTQERLRYALALSGPPHGPAQALLQRRPGSAPLGTSSVADYPERDSAASDPGAGV